jgi:peptide/nickel transport system substrate-binding protein
MAELPMRCSTIGRSARFLTASLLAVAALGACRQPESATERTPAAAASAPRRGGAVVTGWIAEPGGVNEYITPASLITDELLSVIFRRLVQEQPDFDRHPPTFAPELAASYEWSADHKTATFHLRPDAVWSDGVPITAGDVRWTWQAQTNPDVAWDTSHMKRGIRDVEVVDAHTVRFHFDRVYAKQMLDINEGVILPEHAWGKIPFAKWRESGDWFKQHLVCSGPFTISSWTPQQEIVLTRNERFYDKDRPYLDRVVMRFIRDPSSALTQILSGEIDFFPQIPPDQAPRVKADHDLDLITYWSNLYVFVSWNNADPLFADREVRRALTLAIDRKAIVDTILGQYGRVAVSPIISSVWAHDGTLQPFPYDPAQAREILAARGWKDSNGDGVLDRRGKPFAFDLVSNAGNQQRNDAAVMIQSQLAKVGIRVTPRVLEFNTLVDLLDAGKYQAGIMGLSLDTSLDLTGAFHSRSIPGPEQEGTNFERYASPEADRLIDQIAAEPDLADARPALAQVQRVLDRDQPVTLLWESERLSPASKRIHGAQPNQLRSLFNLQDWWVEPPPR